jgi:hypothetical protein
MVPPGISAMTVRLGIGNVFMAPTNVKEKIFLSQTTDEIGRKTSLGDRILPNEEVAP